MDDRPDRKALLETLLRMGKPNLAHAGFQVGGLTKGEFFLLEMLFVRRRSSPESKGMYVSELAERMGVSPPAVSRMLRFTERKGYLSREVDREDRRNTYVVLSPAGEEAYAAMERRALDFAGRVVDRMGTEDTARLVELMTRVSEIVHEELAKGI